MLYYNKDESARSMTSQHHHHPEGHVHPPAAIGPSILRLSAAERIVIATALIALVWGSVIWVMHR